MAPANSHGSKPNLEIGISTIGSRHQLRATAWEIRSTQTDRQVCSIE
ncbi:hypothetical protein ACQJBY_018984 [Aegilops geniculata]